MNTWAVVDWTTDVWHFIVRMLIAVVCGFVIGLERKSRSKEAGIRTHAIVCLAACLFMILSKYLASPLFSDIAGSGFTGRRNAYRVASRHGHRLFGRRHHYVQTRRHARLDYCRRGLGNRSNRYGSRRGFRRHGRLRNGNNRHIAAHLPLARQSVHHPPYFRHKNDRMA